MTQAEGFSSPRSAVVLVTILALALGLRVWGIDFGLPFLYHPDEGALVMPALNILQTGDYQPIRLDYGSAYIYSLAALYIPYFIYGAWQGQFTSAADLPVYADYHQVGAYPYPSVFLVGRFLAALLGALTVLIVYSLGKRLAGSAAGLTAAALLAVNPIHVSNSHFVTTDVPVTLVILIALVSLFDLLDHGRWQDYLGAGFWVGLAASTKYPGGIMLSALLVAHAARARSRSDLLDGRLFLGLAGMGGGFLLGTPYALDLPYFLNWFGRSMSLYGSGVGGPEVLVEGPSALYYARTLFLGPSAPFAVLGVLGLLWFVRREWRRGAVVVAFPITYFALIALQSTRYPRTLLPIIPFLALAAGMLLAAGAGWLANRSQAARFSPAFTLAGLAVVISLWPALTSIQMSARLAGPDVRTLAYEWYNATISSRARVAADPMGPPFTSRSHNLYLTWALAEHSPDWYVEGQFEYMVVSEPLLLDPNLSVEEQSGYRELMSRFTLIKTFEGAMLGSNGIHIWVYRVPS